MYYVKIILSCNNKEYFLPIEKALLIPVIAAKILDKSSRQYHLNQVLLAAYSKPDLISILHQFR